MSPVLLSQQKASGDTMMTQRDSFVETKINDVQVYSSYGCSVFCHDHIVVTLSVFFDSVAPLVSSSAFTAGLRHIVQKQATHKSREMMRLTQLTEAASDNNL